MQLFSTTLKIQEGFSEEIFINSVLNWNRNSPHIDNQIPDLKWDGSLPFHAGNSRLWLDVCPCPAQGVTAVRYEKRDAGKIWDTDYVMDFRRMEMCIRLERSYDEEALDFDPRFSSPFYISTLIQDGWLEEDNGLPVDSLPFTIDRPHLSLLADIINRQTTYRLPIVFVSRTYSNGFPIDVKDLAWKLKGIAHVLIEEDKSLDYDLKRATNGMQEYYGAIGVYYPNPSYGRGGHQFFKSPSINPTRDVILLNRVVENVLRYANNQAQGPLSSWNSVRLAVHEAQSDSLRQERIQAEAALQKTQNELDALLLETDTLIRNAIESHRHETDNLLAVFDEELEAEKQKSQQLQRLVEKLQAENVGLQQKLASSSQIPVIIQHQENDLYPGEIREFAIQAITYAAANAAQNSRRRDVLEDLAAGNLLKKLGEKKTLELKRLLKGYTGMTSKIRKGLKDLGFQITEEGKHYKLIFCQDDRYTFSIAKTPSDHRAGDNDASIISGALF